MIRSKLILIIGILFFLNFSIHAQKNTFKVMAWNILHGGNDIENGPENVGKIINEINPDIILMIETYGSGPYIAKYTNLNFHLVASKETLLNDKSVNLSIYSKYAFGKRIDTEFPFYLGGIEIPINGKTIRFFTNWFHYLPWDNEPEKMGKTVEELLEWEQTESRHKMIQKVLPYLKKFAAETDSIPMIFGGDMNSLSHLDWTKKTKKIHNNLIVPWNATKILDDLGLIDSYRKENPNPKTYPGITWDKKGRNDSHRIDYIFYKGKSIKSVKSKSYNAYFNEPITINNKKIIYPSDHGIVVTTFKLR
ncbi:endonuclease/exonuclease/phosphatase family protein [Flavobacteriaceae bacterium]|nr:endonuclease/exonuclease/phosphatase family protein [Flavobacteriaceae bacterium]